MIEFILFIFFGVFVSALNPGDLNCQTVFNELGPKLGYEVAGVMPPSLGGFGVIMVKENEDYGRRDIIMFKSTAELEFATEFMLSQDSKLDISRQGICKVPGLTLNVLLVKHPGRITLQRGEQASR